LFIAVRDWIESSRELILRFMEIALAVHDWIEISRELILRFMEIVHGS
jgi:hypothetical protein